MRIGNFAALEIDHHIYQEHGRWIIYLRAEETKTRRADIWPLGSKLSGYVSRYVLAVRPKLVAQNSKADDNRQFWIGDSGRPIGSQVLRRIIGDLTQQHLGRRIGPHFFRHCAATTFTLERPDDALRSSALLGHASPAITERHYIIQQRQLVQQDYLGLLQIRRRPSATPAGDTDS